MSKLQLRTRLVVHPELYPSLHARLLSLSVSPRAISHEIVRLAELGAAHRQASAQSALEPMDKELPAAKAATQPVAVAPADPVTAGYFKNFSKDDFEEVINYAPKG